MSQLHITAMTVSRIVSTLALAALGVMLPAAQAATPAKASKPSKAAAKPAAKAAAKAPAKAPVKTGPPEADAEQLAAAQWVYYGTYTCDFDQQVEINLNPTYPAYADVTFKTNVYLMKPVLSSTGAIRLEDVKGQTAMIQIANKSMLMDVKAGRRLVDGCVGQRQRELIEAARLEREQQQGAGGAVAEPLLKSDKP
jgi:beta-lactamase class A